MGCFSGGGGGIAAERAGEGALRSKRSASPLGYRPAPQVSLFCFRLRRKDLLTASTRIASAKMTKPATIPPIAPPERPFEAVEEVFMFEPAPAVAEEEADEEGRDLVAREAASTAGEEEARTEGETAGDEETIGEDEDGRTGKEELTLEGVTTGAAGVGLAGVGVTAAEVFGVTAGAGGVDTTGFGVVTTAGVVLMGTATVTTCVLMTVVLRFATV